MSSSNKKIALVTGSTSKFGQKICDFLFEEGYFIIMHFNNNIIEMQNLLGRYHNKGYKFVTFKSDFSIPNNVKEALSNICLVHGFPSLIINNASYFTNDNFKNMNLARLNKHMNINVISPIMIVNSLVEYSDRALNVDNDFSIINILDYCVGSVPHNKYVSYSFSKMAMSQATTLMAVSLAPKFRVNAIAPGPFMRDENQNEENFDRTKVANLLRYSVTYTDVINSIKFLKDSPSITGQTIYIDGGRFLMGGDFF